MEIHGLQKMTLLDWPEKVVCTVFLGGCDFRCPFCQNSGLITGSTPETIPEDEFLCFFKRRGEDWLDGVCITGGEPLPASGPARIFEPDQSPGLSGHYKPFGKEK